MRYGKFYLDKTPQNSFLVVILYKRIKNVLYLSVENHDFRHENLTKHKFCFNIIYVGLIIGGIL